MNPFEQWLPLYGPGVVAERPWWRPVYQERGDGTRYLIAWRRPDGVTVHDIEVRQAIIDVRAEHDRLNPMPPPPPMCGQVWRTVYPDGSPGFTDTITYTDDRGAYRLYPRGTARMLSRGDSWPPPFAVLVAGPTPYGRDVPWAPAPATQTKDPS